MDLPMRPCLDFVSHGSDELNHGYAYSIKNTFIDVTPQTGGRKRSLSSPSRFEADLTHATPGPLCAAQPAPPMARASISSEDSLKPQKALSGSPQDSDSTVCSVNADPLGDDSGADADFEADYEDGQGANFFGDFLEEQAQRYLINTDNSGRTLMWHGISTKFQVKPDLLDMLAATEAKDVGYLYLPLNNWEKKGKPIGKCRNKGYAFIHFRTEAAASDFEQKAGYETTRAKHQGISVNLRRLVSAPQKRTIETSIYLLNKFNEFELLPIPALRDFVGKVKTPTGR
jgi:hypothetical protein